jgi:cell division protein FtsB
MTTAIKRVAFVAALVMAGGYAYLRLEGPHGLSELQQKRKTIEALELENQKLETEVKRHKKRNWDLQYNPEVIGNEIRIRTNKIQNGDKEFRTPGE